MGNGTASVNHISEVVELKRQVRNKNEHLVEQSDQIAMLTDTMTSLAGQREQNSAMTMAVQYSQGESHYGPTDCSDRGGGGACQQHSNPVFDSQADGAPTVNASNTCSSDECTRHANPVYECGASSSNIAAMMQVETRSKARAKAPSEMERLLVRVLHPRPRVCHSSRENPDVQMHTHLCNVQMACR